MAVAVRFVVPVVLILALVKLMPALVFVVPPAVNAALAFVFARTLRAGREPLISTFARAERGRLEPDLAVYTRVLTGVWVAFFVLAAIGSIVLCIAASLAVWTAFVVLGTQVGVVALFLGEYLFRRWRFPQYRHASPFALAAIVVSRWRPNRSR